jgi:hypothetical protein
MSTTKSNSPNFIFVDFTFYVERSFFSDGVCLQVLYFLKWRIILDIPSLVVDCTQMTWVQRIHFTARGTGVAKKIAKPLQAEIKRSPSFSLFLFQFYEDKVKMQNDKFTKRLTKIYEVAKQMLKATPKEKYKEMKAIALTDPLFVADMDEEGDDPIFHVHLMDQGSRLRDYRMFGIVISDLLDHIANAYHHTIGRDLRDIRADIVKVLRDEDRFKKKDLSRSQMSGTVARSGEEFDAAMEYFKKKGK